MLRHAAEGFDVPDWRDRAEEFGIESVIVLPLADGGGSTAC
ncbi:hypothetical protein [Halosegnis marinus]